MPYQPPKPWGTLWDPGNTCKQLSWLQDSVAQWCVRRVLALPELAGPAAALLHSATCPYLGRLPLPECFPKSTWLAPVPECSLQA